MMQSGSNDLAKQRMQQARTLTNDLRGVRLNLGKKISVPKDVMMEELHLPSNRGSRMFQERQNRMEKFTLENNAPNNNVNNGYSYDMTMFPEPPVQIIADPTPEKENLTQSPAPGFAPGKFSLVTTLQKTVARKGSPNIIAPGYSSPLKEIPHEKFNSTVIPKLYCSPWREALGDPEQIVTSLTETLPQPPQPIQPTNYRCFNRVAMPFGGPMASRRVIPVIGFEAVENQNLPDVTLERLTRRPDFNRAPRGWGKQYAPESDNL